MQHLCLRVFSWKNSVVSSVVNSRVITTMMRFCVSGPSMVCKYYVTAESLSCIYLTSQSPAFTSIAVYKALVRHSLKAGEHLRGIFLHQSCECETAWRRCTLRMRVSPRPGSWLRPSKASVVSVGQHHSETSDRLQGIKSPELHLPPHRHFYMRTWGKCGWVWVWRQG